MPTFKVCNQLTDMKPRFLIHKITSLRATAQTRAGLSELALSGIVNRDKEGRKHCSLLVSALLIFNFAFLLLLSSCISEDLQPSDPSNPPADESFTEITLPGVFSINLQKNVSNSTRATLSRAFHDGDESEYKFAPTSTAADGSKIYHHFMLVYGSSGTPIQFPLELPNEGEDWELEEPTTDNITLTVSKVVSTGVEGLSEYKTIYALVEALNDKNAYFLININESDFVDNQHTNGLASYTEEQLKTKVLNNYSIKVNGIEYFTMTNSTYVDSRNKIITPSKITANNDNIYKTIALAKKGTPICTGYLERLASKFTVSYSDLATNNNIKQDAFTLNFYDKIDLSNSDQGYKILTNTRKVSFKVLGYGVDGLEKNSGLFKTISNNTNYFNGWNNSDLFRCYWNIDQHYVINSDTKKNYPHQFRKGLETDSVRAYHGGAYLSSGKINTNNKGSNYYLDYVSFEDITGGENSPGNYPERFYSHENTYYDQGTNPQNWLWKYGYFSAGTYLLFACQLMIDNEPSDLYKDQNDIYYRSAQQLLEAKLEILNKVILPGGNSGLRILRVNWDSHEQDKTHDLYIQGWNAESVLWISRGGEEKEVTASDLTLIEAEISGGDGQNLIAPLYKDSEATYYLAPKKEDGSRNNDPYDTGIKDENDQPIYANYSVQINYNHLVSLIHKIIGPIDHFNNGYMYYAAPIPHSVTSITADSWKTCGHIGVVRNNWYNLKVTEIKEVGRSVDNPKQPIIPMLDIKRDYLNLNVVVIPMHNLVQDVPLSPSLN